MIVGSSTSTFLKYPASATNKAQSGSEIAHTHVDRANVIARGANAMNLERFHSRTFEISQRAWRSRQHRL